MKFSEVQVTQLNQVKLSLISLGSLSGIGIGLLLSFMVTSTIAKVIIAFCFICISLYVILKNIHLLM